MGELVRESDRAVTGAGVHVGDQWATLHFIGICGSLGGGTCLVVSLVVVNLINLEVEVVVPVVIVQLVLDQVHYKVIPWNSHQVLIQLQLVPEVQVFLLHQQMIKVMVVQELIQFLIV